MRAAAATATSSPCFAQFVYRAEIQRPQRGGIPQIGFLAFPPHPVANSHRAVIGPAGRVCGARVPTEPCGVAAANTNTLRSPPQNRHRACASRRSGRFGTRPGLRSGYRRWRDIKAKAFWCRCRYPPASHRQRDAICGGKRHRVKRAVLAGQLRGFCSRCSDWNPVKKSILEFTSSVTRLRLFNWWGTV